MKTILLFLFPAILFSQTDSIKSDSFFNHLDKEEKNIIVRKGTERAWSGKYVNHYESGIYICKACYNPLFKSESKFKSNCGWPSFDDEIENAIQKIPDYSMGLKRIEICCSNCSGHLGHVFEGEGYTQKNIRHCVNSLSIIFVKSENY